MPCLRAEHLHLSELYTIYHKVIVKIPVQFVPTSSKSSQYTIWHADRRQDLQTNPFKGRHDILHSPLQYCPGLNIQLIIVSVTAETNNKYCIDFNFSSWLYSQLASDFGSAHRSHRTKSSHMKLRIGKNIYNFQFGFHKKLINLLSAKASSYLCLSKYNSMSLA